MAKAIVITEPKELNISSPKQETAPGSFKDEEGQVVTKKRKQIVNTITVDEVKFLINKAILRILPELGLKLKKVDELPETGENGVIYLVPSGSEKPNLYDEYYWLEDEEDFEFLGTTEIDLSNYVTTDTEQTIEVVKTFSEGIIIDRPNTGGNSKWHLEEDNYGRLSLSRTYNDIQVYYLRMDSDTLIPNTDRGCNIGQNNRRINKFFVYALMSSGNGNYGLVLPDTSEFTANKEIATKDEAFNTINATDIVDNTLTQAQYDLINNGKPTLIKGELLGIRNPILTPPYDGGGNYIFGLKIGQTSTGYQSLASIVSQYRINVSTKAIETNVNDNRISLEQISSINSISMSQYYKKPQSSVTVADGETITNAGLKALIENEQPIKLNGFTCYFSCDDGTNYQYVSTRYDANANKNHINVITINKSTWVVVFHTSDIALS